MIQAEENAPSVAAPKTRGGCHALVTTPFGQRPCRQHARAEKLTCLRHRLFEGAAKAAKLARTIR